MRGIMFTTDAAVSLTLSLMVVAACACHFRVDDSSHHMMVRLAHDIGRELERSGALCSSNGSLIDAELELMRPMNLEISADVERYAQLNGSLSLVGVDRHGIAVGENIASADVLSVDRFGNACFGHIMAGEK